MVSSNEKPTSIRAGRGAVSNLPGRFESATTEVVDDGWEREEALPPLETTVKVESARTIITRNDSSDVPFEQSINAYRGCEHGCIYCFARPTHAYFNLSPGLDFETKLFYKPNAVALLETELAKPNYRCKVIAMGTNTDPYQPIEKDYRITRGILELLARCRHPVSIVTKSALIERDLDVLAELAAQQLATVALSITTLDDDLKRRMEPRAASPRARLRAISRLHAAGVSVTVMVAPVVPVLTDHELERILEAAAEAGAQHAGYLVMRLPHEVKDLFKEWLTEHEPLKATHVMSRLHDLRGGRDNDPRFGFRGSGIGIYAQLLEQRFHAACRRFGLNRERRPALNTHLFTPPRPITPQLSLW